MPTFTYDDSVTLPNNKDDGGQTSDTTKATAAEWNQTANAVMDLRTDMRAGDYHGVRDMTLALPAVSPAGGARFVARGNKLTVSESGGPYVWIRNVEYLNITDPRFGAKGDGVTDDAPAINAAIVAALSGTAFVRRVVYIPAGLFRIRSPINVPASKGFTLVGEGKWASRLLSDPSTPGTNALVIDSCQHVTLEGFGIWGKGTNRTGYGIHWNYSVVPPPIASYGHVLRDVWINSDDNILTTGQGFDYGIVWSDAFGNNSEVKYDGVYVFHFKESGVWLPGTQQKSHVFYGCQINGGWDGVAGSGIGGKFGVRAGGGGVSPGTIGGTGGSFQYIGGGVSSCSEGAFSVEYPTSDPIVLDSIQTENNRRFLGNSSNTATASRQSFVIRGCRLDQINDFDADGYIKLPGMGPHFVYANNFYTDVTSGPGLQIRLLSNQPSSGSRIFSNNFLSQNSANFSPVINGGVFDRGDIELDGNIYAKDGASFTPQPRVEFLDNNFTFPNLVSVLRGRYNRAGQCSFRIDAGAFTANATTQSLKVFELPRGTKICGMHVYQFAGFTGSGLSSCSMTIGKTSGGATYMASMNLLETQKFRGNASAELGSDLSGMVNGGYVPDYFATTDIWCNVTTAGMNIGNDTVTNFTAGYFFLILQLEVVQRFVTGA